MTIENALLLALNEFFQKYFTLYDICVKAK